MDVPWLSGGSVGTVSGARRIATAWRTSFTTPSIILAAGVVIVATVVLVGAGGLALSTSYRKDAETIAGDASALVVDAQDLYVALASADAAATTSFLQAGVESTALRTSYADSLQAAGTAVASIAARPARPSATQSAIRTLTETLPVYAGLVETARTNDRLQFPVGAAYLRDASDLMRETILPAATEVYATAATELDLVYRSGTSPTRLGRLLVGAATTLVLIVLTHVFLVLRTRRMLHPALIAAGIVVTGFAVFATNVFDDQRASLMASQRTGADPVLVTSTSRILVLRSLSAENLDLVERGTDPVHMEDFATIIDAISAQGDDAGADEDRPIMGTSSLTRNAFVDYLDVHDDIRALAAAGDYDAAVAVAIEEQGPAVNKLDRLLDIEIRDARGRLEDKAADARDALRWLTLVSALATALTAALVIIGLRPRVREYR